MTFAALNSSVSWRIGCAARSAGSIALPGNNERKGDFRSDVGIARSGQLQLSGGLSYKLGVRSAGQCR